MDALTSATLGSHANGVSAGLAAAASAPPAYATVSKVFSEATSAAAVSSPSPSALLAPGDILQVSAFDHTQVQSAAGTVLPHASPSSSPEHTLPYQLDDVRLKELFDAIGISIAAAEHASTTRSSFVLGRSGSGKSTFINNLGNCTYSMNVVENGDDVKMVFELVEGVETAPRGDKVESGTSVLSPPSTIADTSQTVIDCPGFDDNRGIRNKMPIDIAFCSLFKTQYPIPSLIIVIPAQDLVDTRCPHLFSLATQFASLVSNPDLVKNSILFVITKLDEVATKFQNTYFKNEKLCVKRVTSIIADSKQAAEAHHLHFLLSLVREDNIIFSDITTVAARRQLLQKLQSTPPIPGGSIQFQLKEHAYTVIKNFVDECLRLILRTREDESRLTSQTAMIEESINATTQELRNLEEQQTANTNRVFNAATFTGQDALITHHSQAIDRITASIAQQRELLLDRQAKKGKLENEDRTEHDTVKKSLAKLNAELAGLIGDFNNKNVDDEVYFLQKPFIIDDSRWPFFGWFSWTSEVYEYRGKPYTRVEVKCGKRRSHQLLKDWATYDNSVRGHTFTTKINNKAEGVYSAKYETDLGVDGYCQIEIIGKKRVYFAREIATLHAQIRSKQGEIALVNELIAPITLEIANIVARLTELERDLSDQQTQMRALQQSNQTDREAFERAVREAKIAFDTSKEQEHTALAIAIHNKTSHLRELEQTLVRLREEYQRVVERKRKEETLHVHSPLLRKICDVVGINSDTATKFKRFDLVAEDPTRDFACPILLVRMSEPYKHKPCNTSFEKSAILGYIAKGAPCPHCQRPLTIEDIEEDTELKHRIMKFTKRVIREAGVSTNSASAEAAAAAAAASTK